MTDRRWVIWVGGKPYLGPTERYDRLLTREEAVEFVWKRYNRVIGPNTEVLLQRGTLVRQPLELAVPQNPKEA